jgi:riboflavin biosynthesis pyrimidine reductase
VDSGGKLTGVLLRSPLVDEVSVLFPPKLNVGYNAQSIYNAPVLSSTEDVIELILIAHQILEENHVILVYRYQELLKGFDLLVTNALGNQPCPY